MLKKVLMCLVATFPLLVNASTYSQATGKIKSIYHYGNGRVLVTGFSFPNTTCNNNGGFWISQNHPKLSDLLGTLIYAHARDAELTVKAKVTDCWYPEIDTTYESRIILSD